MKILVIGGSGLIGSKVVANLRQLGYEVLVGAPSTGINTLTGKGLADAVKGAQVVIDLSNSPSFEDQAVLNFFETSGRNLLAAEKTAGVKHHIALSVVGTDRMLESGYFRAKMAQENLIKASKVPYTIVRSTQFFEFLGGIAQYGTVNNEIRLSPAQVQPISSDDIAAIMSDAALPQAINATFDVAGPEKFGLAELMKRYLLALDDKRIVVPDVNAAYYGAQINDQSLTPLGEARLGTSKFDAWLAKSKSA
tara:strand:- start:99143 stop:99895 length:753 start_codon:yes stop_codon:yes gene_type:complete